jgi:hypothetical protein
VAFLAALGIASGCGLLLNVGGEKLSATDAGSGQPDGGDDGSLAREDGDAAHPIDADASHPIDASPDGDAAPAPPDSSIEPTFTSAGNVACFTVDNCEVVSVLSAQDGGIAVHDDWFGPSSPGWHDYWWPASTTTPRFKLDTPMATLSRSPTHYDLFAVDIDGNLMTRSLEQTSGPLFSDWITIDSGIAPSAPLAAVALSPTQMTVLVTSASGELRAYDWEASANHGSWNAAQVHVIATNAPAGAEVAALVRSNKYLDVFFTANDGRIYNPWLDSGHWNAGVPRTFHIFPLVPGGGVAVARRSADQIDLFAVAQDGTLISNSYLRGSWGDKEIKISSSRGAAGAPIAALGRTPKNLDVFTISVDGQHILSTWLYTDDGLEWDQTHGFLLPGFTIDGVASRVAAITRSIDSMDVFATGLDGHVRSAGWGAASQWYWVGGNLPIN